MAGSPGGQVIGRVSVKVLPDTSGFARAAERQLKNEIKNASIKVKVDVELNKKALDKVRDDLRKWTNRINPIKVEVRPELAIGSTTLINARLNYMARMRTVPILPYLVPGSVQKVTSQLGAMMAAFSGGRLMKNIVTDFGNWMKRLDEIAPKIGLVTMGLVGLTGLGLTAASNLFALSASLAQIGAVALTLPATFASAAIGVGVLIAVFKDFNTVLPSVGSALSRIQDSISAKFWEQAKAPMADMIDRLLPQFAKGLDGTASAFGSFFAGLSNALSNSLGGAPIAAMFGSLNSAIGILRQATAPLAGIITTLGQQGAAYLPRMAKWVVEIATAFDAWLLKVTNSGQFQQWVDGGLQALSDLGSVLANLGGILAGISRAASAAGGSSLGMMADTLERVHAVVDSPAFQAGLTSVFMAAHQAMNLIATTSGPAVETFFSTLSTLLSTLLPVVGQAIGTLVSSLATAFSNPAFTQGFTQLITGIGAAIQGLAPAMTPIASMLGAVGTALGTFFASVGPILGTVLTTLAQAFQRIVPALEPLIRVLSGALGAAFTALAPVITQFAAILANLVTGSVLPALVTAFSALLPVISALAPIVGDVLAQAFAALAPILPMIANAFALIAPMIGQLVVAILPLVGALLPALASILQPLITVLMSVAMAVLPPLIAAIQQLVPVLIPVITFIGQLVALVVSLLGPALVFLASLITSMVVGLISGITSLFEGITGIFQGFITMFSGGWDNFWKGLQQVAMGLWNVLKGAFLILINVGILGVARKGIAVLKSLWSATWSSIKGVAVGLWNSLKTLWNELLSSLKSAPKKALGDIKAAFQLAWSEIKNATKTAFGEVVTAVRMGIEDAVRFVASLPGAALAALGSLGTYLSEAGRSLIDGFINGIKGAIGGVKTTLQDLTKKLTDWKGPESLDRVLLVNAGQLLIRGLVKGMESEYDGVRRSLQGLTSDIGSTTIAGPQIADLSGSYSAINGALGASTAGPAGGGFSPTVQVSMQSNSSPEDVADAILFAQKKLAYGSAYAM